MAIEQLRVSSQIPRIRWGDYENSKRRLIWAKRLHFGCERYKQESLETIGQPSDADLNKINSSLNHLIHSGGEIALFSDINGQMAELLVDNRSLFYHDTLQKLPDLKIDDPTIFAQFERTSFSINPKFNIYRWNNKQKEKLFSANFPTDPSSPQHTVVLGKEPQSKLWKTFLVFNNRQQPHFSIRPDLITRTK